ncbi:MAG: hypothetical protein FWJ73_00665 [Limnochordales bacterium]|nr:hypothetical protein [Bacillota bacterium]
MRKAVALILACLMLALTSMSASAQDVSLPALLAAAEQAVYGSERTGSLLERIVRLELDVYGREQSGALLTRAQNIYAYLTGAIGGGSSVVVQLNVVEYMVFQRLSTGVGLVQRIEELERSILGAPQQSRPLAERVRSLVELVWPSGELNLQRVHLPAETLVRVRLLTEINSGRNQVGDRIRYRVVEDVRVDGRIVIPAGAEGEGRVTAVQSAGRFGQAGRVEIDWGTVPTFDGTPVRFAVLERAGRQNQELAVAASIAGLMLLPPVGLIGGFLVQGGEHVVPAGTEFYVEVARPVDLLGLSLTPVRSGN